VNKIEREVNQVSENKEEYDYGFDGKIENLTLNASSIVNSILSFFAKDWSEEDRKRLLFSDLECKLFDKAITPWIYNVAVRLGLAVAEVFSLVIIVGLLLPRALVILTKNAKKTPEAKKDENLVEGVVNS